MCILERVRNAFLGTLWNAFQNAFGTHFGTRSERAEGIQLQLSSPCTNPRNTVASYEGKMPFESRLK